MDSPSSSTSAVTLASATGVMETSGMSSTTVTTNEPASTPIVAVASSPSKSAPVAVPTRMEEKSMPSTVLGDSLVPERSTVFSVFVPSSTWSSWSSRSKLHVPSWFTTSVNTGVPPTPAVAVSVSASVPWTTL